MSRTAKLVVACFALLAGQAIYGALQSDPNWSLVWERVWFQINAVVLYEVLWTKL